MSKTHGTTMEKSGAAEMEYFSGSSDEEELDTTPPEFYDPDMDEKDEVWAERKRQGRKSDALLSCPACFTTLCLDCQRHETIVTQYRAMFVLNCKILDGNSEGFNPDSGQQQQYLGEPQQLQRVACEVCDTEVGVIDKDEVYHFFNVLPSYV